MSRPNRSIASLLAVVSAVTTTLVLGGFAFYNYRAEHAFQIQQLQSKASVLVDQLAFKLTVPVANFDRDQIDKIIESVMRDAEIYAVVVKSGATNSLIRAGVRSPRWEITGTNREPAARGLLVETRSIVAGSKKLGTVTLLASPRFVGVRLQQALVERLIIIAVFAGLLGTVLYLLLWRLVLQHIQSLERLAKTIGTGQNEREAVCDSRFFGELESLRTSLTDMIGRLQARLEELQVSEEKFAKAFHGNSVSMVITRAADGVIMEANEVFARRYGLTCETVRGKSAHEIGVWGESPGTSGAPGGIEGEGSGSKF